MRQNELGPIFLTIIFYAVLAYGLYCYVGKKKHASQPVFKSFLWVVLPVLAICISSAVILFIIDQFVDISRNHLVSASIAGAIICCILGTVRWSFGKIKKPVEGYNPTGQGAHLNREILQESNWLQKARYIEKYRVTEKALNRAIEIKKIRAEVIDGLLYIEDRKF